MSTVMYNILSIVVFMVIIGCLFYFNKKSIAKRIIYNMVVEAENKFGSGTGPIKYEYVISNIYPELPPVVRFFVTGEKLDAMVEDALAELKKLLKE